MITLIDENLNIEIIWINTNNHFRFYLFLLSKSYFLSISNQRYERIGNTWRWWSIVFNSIFSSASLHSVPLRFCLMLHISFSQSIKIKWSKWTDTSDSVGNRIAFQRKLLLKNFASYSIQINNYFHLKKISIQIE